MCEYADGVSTYRSVLLFFEDYEELLEDLDDLAVVLVRIQFYTFRSPRGMVVHSERE